MKLLVTAFKPFGGRACNTSADLLAELRKKYARPGLSSYKFVVLPVNFRRSWPMLSKQIDSYKPDAVICLGEKRTDLLTLETTARNHRISSQGLMPIAKNSAQRITSRLPVKKIGTALQRHFSPTEQLLQISGNAGAYLCNFIYYKMLSLRREIPALFVHVPALSAEDFMVQRKKLLVILRNIIIELIKAIDGAGAKYTSREN